MKSKTHFCNNLLYDLKCQAIWDGKWIVKDCIENDYSGDLWVAWTSPEPLENILVVSVGWEKLYSHRRGVYDLESSYSNLLSPLFLELLRRTWVTTKRAKAETKEWSFLIDGLPLTWNLPDGYLGFKPALKPSLLLNLIFHY